MATLSLEPKNTALVAIDLQRGLVGVPTEPHAMVDVVARSRRIAEAARAKGAFVVWVRVSFSAGHADALQVETDAPAMTAAARPAGWDELVDGLVAPGDHVVTKRQWGAFYGTDLELQLRRRGVSTLLLTGVATCFGVESTARQAYELGFRQVFVEDAIAARAAAEHAHTVARIFPRMGLVRSTGDVLAALAALAALA